MYTRLFVTGSVSASIREARPRYRSIILSDRVTIHHARSNVLCPIEPRIASYEALGLSRHCGEVVVRWMCDSAVEAFCDGGQHVR